MSLAQWATEGLAVTHSFGTSQYVVTVFTGAGRSALARACTGWHYPPWADVLELFAGGKCLKHRMLRLHSHKPIKSETSRPDYNAQRPPCLQWAIVNNELRCFYMR